MEATVIVEHSRSERLLRSEVVVEGTLRHPGRLEQAINRCAVIAVLQELVHPLP